MVAPTAARRAIMPRSTYYDRHYKMTSALIRARQQYLVKNMVSGVALAGFVLGVYAYTIKAVAQDDFSDVPIPDAPPQNAHIPNTGVQTAASEEGLNIRKQAAVARMKP